MAVNDAHLRTDRLALHCLAQPLDLVPRRRAPLGDDGGWQIEPADEPEEQKALDILTTDNGDHWNPPPHCAGTPLVEKVQYLVDAGDFPIAVLDGV